MTMFANPARRAARRTAGAVAAAAALALAGAGVSGAAPPHGAGPPPSGPPEATTSAGEPVDLGALFIGAHPDDEAWQLSSYGQWGHENGLRTGVVTVTRGEGGGNAVGPEEGPPLGLLREEEERSAVAKAGITEVFNLDEVDFYYTVSQPLTQQVWDHEQVLGKVVRIIRQTRPELLFTMDPAPSPGNHGNHQEAARLASEAFDAAADPARFPEQITAEGLRPFAPDKILLRGRPGSGPVGQRCVREAPLTDPTQTVYGVWGGATAPDGRTWAAVEREAQREYASQGWAVFPDVPSDPEAIGCDYVRQLDSRVPFAEPGTTAAYPSWATLAGSTVRAPGAVPLGTRLRVDTEDFGVLAGEPFEATVTLTAPAQALPGARVTLEVPDGWTVAGSGAVGTVPTGRTVERTFTVTPAADAGAGDRHRVIARLSTRAGSGYSDRVVQVLPPVSARQQLLPQVADFEQWASQTGQPQLSGTVTPVLSLPSGGSREVRVDVRNNGSESQSGDVTLDLPAGFSASPASAAYGPVPAGDERSVAFTVTNTDASLPTSNQGGTPAAAAGDYAYTIVATSRSGTATSPAALELVPATSIQEATAAPVVDGVESEGEYPGAALDISRRWEGAECSSPGDCSATAKVAWHGDTLNVLVHVVDDVLGTRLETSDCKRHWRTDSVEIAVDPRGDSENTSTTFKAAVLPATAEGPACGLRDADNHQGPAAQAAPGMEVASTVAEPYDGYTVEVAIPMAELPGAVDPEHLGLNLFVYDSDTQDKTGQSRIGWSTWGGVQGDPYRWGVATLPGYQPPAGRPAEAPDPVIPTSVLSSLDSPPSIEQAVRVDVPLAGDAASPPEAAGWVGSAEVSGGTVRVSLVARGPGQAHVHVVDADGTVGSRTVDVVAGTSPVTVELDRALGSDARVLVGWLDPAGGTLASRTALE